MDIHKPKAAHSWREFLIEIGTIVCGILIALGLEQVVEHIRSEHQVKEAHEAINQELTFNLARVRFTNSGDRCREVRLGLFEQWSAGTAKLESTTLFSTRNRPLFSVLRASAWDIAKTGAVATHMPLDDRLKFGNVYDLIASANDALNEESRVWVRFAGFSGKGALDAADAKVLREDVGVARAYAEARKARLGLLDQRISELGIKPGHLANAATLDPGALCASPNEGRK